MGIFRPCSIVEDSDLLLIIILKLLNVLGVSVINYNFDMCMIGLINYCLQHFLSLKTNYYMKRKLIKKKNKIALNN